MKNYQGLHVLALVFAGLGTASASAHLRAKTGNATATTERQLDFFKEVGDTSLSLAGDVTIGILGDAPVFKTCDAPNKQMGVVPDGFLDPLSQCYRSIQAPLQIFRGMAESLFGDLATNEVVKGVFDAVFKPFEEILENVEKALGFEGVICAGDFDAVEVVQPEDRGEMVGTCQGMPLSMDNNAEWSIFAGTITLTPEKSTAVCQMYSAVTFSFCMALSFCDILPSVAFFMDGGVANCILNQIGRALAATGGGAVATAIISVLTTIFEVGFKNAGFGFSLSNAFEIPMPLFNGEELFWHRARPTQFTKLAFSIESASIHTALKDYFTLTGDVIQGINVLMPNGEPISEKLFDQGLEGFDARVADNIAKQFEDFQVQTVLQGTLQLKLNFHNVPFIGTLFPEFEFEFGRVNAFISTGKQDLILDDGSARSVYPGMSAFIGQSGNERILADAIRTIIKSLDGIIDSLLPRMEIVEFFTGGKSVGDIVAEFLLEQMDLEVESPTKSYGLAVTMNAEYIGFIISVPILLGKSLAEPVADFTFRCTTDYEKLGCEIEFDNVSALVTAIAKEIEGGIIWIWKEVDEFFKFEETAETIGEAFERAGEQAQQVFSKENIEQTLKDIVEGKLDVDQELQELASIGYAAISAFCNDEAGCKPDGTSCFGDPLGLKKKQGACCDCCNDDTDWVGLTTSSGLPGRACGTEPKWKDGTFCLAGLTCHMCENESSDWLSVPSFGDLPGHACGKEPCWADGRPCLRGISCESKCCSDDFMFAKCGKKGCLGDGTACLLGTSCFDCCNGETWWHSKFGTACGVEPKWSDGTGCLKGINCQMCQSGTSSDWLATPPLGLPGHACGHEPCWEDGHNCVNGISCHKCCSSDHMEFKCGKQGCWGDGTLCLFGGCKNCCSHENSWWDDKIGNACGRQPCWGGGRECGLVCHRCCGGSHEKKQGFWDFFPKRYCN
ncbi:FAT tumor suppressor homolog [Seminavis robusta]|uniref:FAT tumor suppressor homolog n=1 Tax=Seminavis robusta TaxID=568900 RepID=A0A9N8DIH3_9STRA|nr:FAT tumor suppressor homolog [Seminavis robusta]|eukprot:Sro103_g052590.1 FAT tumor suppressor homolog (954) ;mRNA; f:85562-89415